MKRSKEADNKHFWKRWAGAYDRFMHSNERLYDQIACEIKKRLSRNMHVLEKNLLTLIQANDTFQKTQKDAFLSLSKGGFDNGAV